MPPNFKPLPHFGMYTTEATKPPLRIWGKNRGQKAALFESSALSIASGIAEVKREGFERAMVEIK